LTPHDLVLSAAHLLALAQLARDTTPDPRAVARERAVLAAVLAGKGEAPPLSLVTSEAIALALLAVRRARQATGLRATAAHARQALDLAPRFDTPLQVWRALVSDAAAELDLAASSTPRRSALQVFERHTRRRRAIEALRPALAALLNGSPTADTARALRDAADQLSPPAPTAEEAA
jgi:hypothetical protein